ncbi:uncharacterized protein (TIGR02453 family) [Pontibacter ummariensis]|uniref:TIGR02453 family protein n=1 Tax=Pontibacter ummariensis TaxID=1610492 RepID=A0A239JQL2_9BACT|nr:DUF2461 domain-containing protein [Pontibacter ummariensis]PRY07391.1 uncharacterized protein (TIGR02453 family) [Pontibacter ummariensis]SNT08326.1 TIGR02453 family protein [Pontibacter ummariensis]
MPTTISQSSLTFLAELAEHNTREWFSENKKRYETARKEYINFLNELLLEMQTFEPVVHGQQGRDLVFRIYRDVRFSNDKRPYKDHFGAYIAEGGRKSVYPGYYLHLAGNNSSFVAGGLWYPPAEQLKAVRQEIDYNLDAFKEIVESEDFNQRFGGISGEKLKTTPKGYDKENPAIEYLRFKGWNGIMPLTDETVLRKDFMAVVLDAFQALKPLNDFLMAPLQDLGED